MEDIPSFHKYCVGYWLDVVHGESRPSLVRMRVIFDPERGPVKVFMEPAPHDVR